ncbi:MAG: DUF1804 family protein [Bacteroidetes bacterium]|nr:DUF1804 family protein [Bacteroidota bacterium]
MAKENEKQIAQSLYIEQCLTAKEIAKKLKVSEKTVGNWVDKGNWKELRISTQTTPDVLISKYNELLNILLDKRLKIEKSKDKDGEDTMRSVIDEMSKVSAMIERLQIDGKASLRTHIHCLEKFMASLHQNNAKLFMQLIDFQKEYLTLLAEELK